MRINRSFSKLLHEPLIHFIVLGIGIFVLYSLLNTSVHKDEAESITITQSKIQALSIAFLKERGRAPTADEMKKLLDSEIREEIFSREALAIGLEKDDLIIRRRLSQKMQYLFDDLSVIEEPSDEHLHSFIKANPSPFTLEAKRSFSQVYLNPELHKKSLDEDLKSLKRSLVGIDVNASYSLGDSSLLGYTFLNQREEEILRRFGESFSKKVFEAPLQSWYGPFESAYGWHFIFVHAKEDATLAPFTKIRKKALQEYRRIKGLEANERFYNNLKKKYEIKVDDEVLKVADMNAI